MSASDYIPYAVGACVVFSVVRWLLSKKRKFSLGLSGKFFRQMRQPALGQSVAVLCVFAGPGCIRRAGTDV